MAPLSQPLVWIDCEMTGLDPDHDHIIEVYCLVTDGQLQPARGPDGRPDPGWGTVVHCPRARLDQMDAWCTAHHGASGLTDASAASAVTPAAAADALGAYLDARLAGVPPGTALLAGNSVHADRAFLRRAPWDRVLARLHYRLLDVSALKEAARRWGASATAAAPAAPAKTGTHRAREDILESIAEARHYKEVFFDRPEGKR